MNFQQLRYALEVAKTQSISRAADNLYMGQPNLSRSIRELEESLGIAIFERSKQGISVTPDGEEFLRYARRIIAQVEEVEQLFAGGKDKGRRFSACVPRASYISRAFTRFVARIGTDSPIEVFYKETNSARTLNNLQKEEYDLGIVRYQSLHEEYYHRSLADRGMTAEIITEFHYLLVTSKSSPLCRMEKITADDLKSRIEICHADPFVPSLPLVDVKKAELSESVDKRIFVFERGSQFELLSSVPNTFMWVSPIPADLLEKHGLVQIHCNVNPKLYRDVLVYRKNYKLTALDKSFIDELVKAKREVLE